MTKFLENDRIWRGMSIFLLTTLVAIVGWGLMEVVAMPKTYLTIATFNIEKQEIVRQICNLKEDMSKQIESLKADVQTNQTVLRDRLVFYQTKIENKIDHLSDLMLEHMSDKPIKGKK